MSAPAMPLPPGGDVNRAPTLIAVTWVECSLSTIVVALRFYCRVRITRNVWWDDWVILITLVTTLLKDLEGRAYFNAG